jgi:drug/metabolite transporter (DMT)-like permease
MSASSVIRLLLLSAIWGASFLFMRVSAPFFLPTDLIFWRVALGALFLLGVSAFMTSRLDVRQNFKHFLVLGMLTAALPFSLFAFAAQTVSASLLAILNSTAPIWAALIGSLWFKTKTTLGAMVGMVAGIVGVSVLTGFESLKLPAGGLTAILAALGATLCYGIGSHYIRLAKPIGAVANAHGSMWGATILLAPLFLLTEPTSQTLPPTVIASVFLLGVLCSGIAFLLYFRLVADIGATSALTVTFLIPVFGVLWGVVFLNEAFGWHTFLGAGLIFFGLSLVTGLANRVIKRSVDTVDS